MAASRPDSVADPFNTAPNTPSPPLGDLPPQNATRPSSYLSPETARTSVVTNSDPAGPESASENIGSIASSRPGSQFDAQLQPDPQPLTPDPTDFSLPELDGVLLPPRASFFQSQTPETGSTPRESIVHTVSTEGLGAALLIPQVEGSATPVPEAGTKLERGFPLANEAAAPDSDLSGEPIKRKPFLTRRFTWIFLFALAIALIILAVILPVYFTVIKPKNLSTNGPGSGSGSGGSGSGSGPPIQSPGGATTGGNGSIVTTSDGSTFTYINPFGGYWVADPKNPFNNNARPNSWTPPLNTSWTWGKDKVYGVNLGGLFVLEPFISPALYQKYPGAVDEWTLTQLMAADTASGGLNQLEDHYNTFITEQDIAEMAGAGLNWIRLPIPFWAIEKWDFEPFFDKVCWPYILRVFQWARKYGLRINLDLHTIPGSQNGYNHSGKLGSINFMNGVMGIANAERAINYIRIITEFISQPEWQPVVPVFSIINEALVPTIGKSQMTSFYLRTHNMIRNITGYGEGHGPYIAIHDGFQGLADWAGFLVGSDRIMIDVHPYFAFSGGIDTSPIATGVGASAGGKWPADACSVFGPPMNQSQTAFGVSIAGEFSNGYNPCGLFVTGVPDNSLADCALFLDASQWNDTMKAGIQEFAMASMDALQNWFFWTWKVGNSTSGHVEAPLWSYKLGLEQGWMPTDPRTALGTCAALGVSGTSFDGTYLSWQTGGAGAGTISPASISSFPYPPTSIAGLAAGAIQSHLPTYTLTGSPVPTLPPPTFSPSPPASVTIGNGWFDPNDQALSPTEVSGCSYPNAWDAVSSAVPAAPCPATATATDGGAGPIATPAVRRA